MSQTLKRRNNSAYNEKVALFSRMAFQSQHVSTKNQMVQVQRISGFKAFKTTLCKPRIFFVAVESIWNKCSPVKKLPYIVFSFIFYIIKIYIYIYIYCIQFIQLKNTNDEVSL